ncbi:sialate O-acetylesterase [Carboxylicivirga sp. RSCT41]|uniref:sialate O-acetylesterase n=1 Tax=Carboxylicivirga agarovorans TaxID=3417570 RepID=UPI003D33A0BB
MKRMLHVAMLVFVCFVVQIVSGKQPVVALENNNISGELSVPNVFSSNMVLQQNDEVKIWGTTLANQEVTIESTWASQLSTTADANGNWLISFNTPAASFDPQSIRIFTNDDEVILSDVLIGEVWLCAGQSNMALRMLYEDNGDAEIGNAGNVPLRLFNVPTTTASEPQSNIANTTWEQCSPTSLENFSAVAYYFGKELINNLTETPIGLINASFGSSSIEAFMSKEALLSKTYLADHYNTYETTVESKVPTAVYNAMIHPLLDCSVKGVAWYQGESNCVRASHYYEALETMIQSWRNEFNSTNLPFYLVQLPPYDYTTSQQESGNPYSAATVREAQRMASKNIANTGLIVTMDQGDVNDLHPTNKKEVGARLANTVLNQTYSQTEKIYSGPDFKSYSVEGNTIRLTFDFVENGIIDNYAELNWFTIAGSDKKFYQGNAFVDGNDIVVSSPYVDEPMAVRFAWYNTAVPNFFNTEGLPASPFKTDDWTAFTYTTNITSWSSMPDIRNVAFDLSMPELTQEAPAAGKRVKQTLAAYEGTNVYHTLYLPTNWEAGKQYPVIVEYAGNGPYFNKYGDVCTGKPDDTYMGYGISGGEDFIWISMPFVSEDGQDNQLYWWGDIEASVQYTINTVNYICNNYGGNSSLVFVAGFSRGAIACNYIGLHNDEIASLWCGSIANSHYDGVLTHWSYPNADSASALERLQRLNGKPQLIIQEGAGPAATKTYIEGTGVEGDFSYLSIPYRNHDLRWVLQDIPQRATLRNWVNDIIECEAIISGPSVVQQGETVDVSIELKGTAPWQLSYTVNGYAVNLNDISTSPYTFQEVIDENTVIAITHVADAIGRGTPGDQLGIYLFEDEIGVVCDGMVRQTQADGYYTSELIEQKNASSWGRKGLFSFDISGFNEELAGAAFQVFLNKSSSSTFNNQVMVYGVNEDDFTCGVTTWDNLQAISFIETGALVNVDESLLGTYLSFDVSDYLNHCINEGQANMVLCLDGSSASHVLYYNAMESTENRPKLLFASQPDGFPTDIIQSKLDEQKLVIYPNPSNGHFYIENPLDKKDGYSIYDSSGRLIRQCNIEAFQREKVSNLIPGLYVVTVDGLFQKVIVR